MDRAGDDLTERQVARWEERVEDMMGYTAGCSEVIDELDHWDFCAEDKAGLFGGWNWEKATEAQFGSADLEGDEVSPRRKVRVPRQKKDMKYLPGVHWKK